ncbi:uncharacterized protein LOC130690529 [Daphnia carinata]|uniref:uncharacterized protein LOC130690529 n=1 Tax=Daphnia carinata TaxID=120202 RepID=UPI00257D6E6D|nr:uncharacterized protein LOC130690529 [Daphnia carinata]
MVSAQVRLALQAMRYYRLWIYASNLVLMAGVVIFASVAAALLSDPRRQLLPPSAVSPHQPSVVYAYAALVLQGAVLPVVGCLGALRLSEKLLNSYWILLLVLLAGDMLVGIVWVFRFQRLVAGLVPDLKSRLSLDYGNDADFDAAWDLLQRSARCCGVESPADFNNSHWLANLADRPAWQPAGLSSNRVQVASTPHGRPLRPSLIGDQRVSRLPLPDSCCKSASFNSDQLRKNGFMSMASEVPPGRKEVYGTGKHRQQLRDYNERYHERMMREQLHLQQQQQQQQQLAGNMSLNHRSVTAIPHQGSVRIQRRATTPTAAPTIAMSPSVGHKKDGQQHRNQQQHAKQQRHRLVPSEEKEADDEEDEDDEDGTDGDGGPSVECGGVWPSVGDVSDVHESGCGEYVSSWLHMTGDTLFVLGYCVLAFVKLCFLAILRYELREMVAKIKILQSEQALMNSSAAGGVAGAAGPANNMPFTHCEMSGIRAVMARGTGAPVPPPALVATEVATDLHDNFINNTSAGQANRESTHLPNGEVPSGGGTTTTTSTTGLCALRIPRPRRQSSFSSAEYHLINPFVQQQQPQQQLQQQGEEDEDEEEGDNETDNDLFSPPDTPIHHLQQQQQQQQQQHRTLHQLPQNNDNGADSDSGSHCALLPSSCNSTGLPQRRLIHKEWDPSDQTTTIAQTTIQQQSGCTSNWVQPLQQQLQHENGWPGRPNGNNNEYHELREIKQTQI